MVLLIFVHFYFGIGERACHRYNAFRIGRSYSMGLCLFWNEPFLALQRGPCFGHGPTKAFFYLQSICAALECWVEEEVKEGRLVTLNQRDTEFKTNVMSVAFSTFSILRANYKACILTSFGGKGFRDFFLMGIVWRELSLGDVECLHAKGELYSFDAF